MKINKKESGDGLVKIGDLFFFFSSEIYLFGYTILLTFLLICAFQNVLGSLAFKYLNISVQK